MTQSVSKPESTKNIEIIILIAQGFEPKKSVIDALAQVLQKRILLYDASTS